jgi:hypothetical protein
LGRPYPERPECPMICPSSPTTRYDGLSEISLLPNIKVCQKHKAATTRHKRIATRILQPHAPGVRLLSHDATPPAGVQGRIEARGVRAEAGVAGHVGTIAPAQTSESSPRSTTTAF